MSMHDGRRFSPSLGAVRHPHRPTSVASEETEDRERDRNDDEEREELLRHVDRRRTVGRARRARLGPFAIA
jgi:hypothetical protein